MKKKNFMDANPELDPEDCLFRVSKTTSLVLAVRNDCAINRHI